MNKISGIYKIINRINGKIYIGQSIDIYRRWKEESHFYKCNDYLRNAFNKYGLENFDFEILEECSIEELDEKEIYYISLYRSNEHKFGYNLTSGGSHCNFTDKAKAKMSKSHKGKNCGKTHPLYGKHHSIESKKKMSESQKGNKNHLGHKHSEQTKSIISKCNSKKVKCIETGCIYNSIKEASEKTNTNNACICLCCKGKLKKTNGFSWCYF